MQYAGPNRIDGAFEAPFLNPLDNEASADRISRRLELADSFAAEHSLGSIHLNGSLYLVSQAFDDSCKYLSRVIPGEGVVQEEVGGRVLNVPVEDRYVVFGYNGFGLLTGPTTAETGPAELSEDTYGLYTEASDEEHAQFESDLNAELEAAKCAYFLGEYVIREYGDLLVHDTSSLRQFYVDGSTGEHYDVEDKAEIEQPLAHTLALGIEGRDGDDKEFVWQYAVSTPSAGSLTMQLRASRKGVQGLIEETDHAGGRKSLRDMDEEEVRDTVVMIETALNDMMFSFQANELQTKKSETTKAINRLGAEEQKVEVSVWDEESMKMKPTGRFRRATAEEIIAKKKSLREAHARTGFGQYSLRRLEPRERQLRHPYALRFAQQDG